MSSANKKPLRILSEVSSERKPCSPREFLRTAPDGALILDEDGIVLRANARFAAILGYEPDELERRDFLDLVRPDLAEQVRRRLYAALRTGKASAFSESCLVKNGEYRALDWNWTASGSLLLGTAVRRAEERPETTVEIVIDRALGIVRRGRNDKVAVIRDYGRTPPLAIPESRIMWVFVNLLENALSAISRSGSVVIETRLRGDRVVAAVTDTGSGADAEDTLEFALCRSIIDRFGGRISLDAERGQGSTVTVTLPLPS